ncbi:MAG: hypothetical protein EXS31_19260 [Pedosphaera sp.]|nr:hypothetical protein [Pedosphaera sp.]
MHNTTHNASNQSAGIEGDVASLSARLGSPDLASWGQTATQGSSSQIRNLPELRQFIHAYCDQALVPRDLPVIRRAFHHSSRSEARELIALDVSLSHDTALIPFARASQHVGRGQLRRLEPLRDQRLVQRYLAAVRAGEAKGWHPVVFGLTLAIYSLPLRQGMIHYATQTMNGFVHSAAGPLQLRQADCDELLSQLDGRIPKLVSAALDTADTASPRLITT